VVCGVKCSFTLERAKVEQVIQTESSGHRFVAYVVTQNTGHIVVSLARHVCGKRSRHRR
jgi:hypothetical protein